MLQKQQQHQQQQQQQSHPQGHMSPADSMAASR
jgi:hypothetical protein